MRLLGALFIMERGYHSAAQIVREIREAAGLVGDGGSLVEVANT